MAHDENQRINAHHGVKALQDRLLVLIADKNICRNEIRVQSGIPDGGDVRHNIFRYGRDETHDLPQGKVCLAQVCLAFNAAVVLRDDRLGDYGGNGMLVQRRDGGNGRTAKPLRDKPGFPVRGAYELLDARNGADRAELGQCRLAAVRLGDVRKRCQQDVSRPLSRRIAPRGARSGSCSVGISQFTVMPGNVTTPRSTTSGRVVIFGFLNIFWHNRVDVILSQEGKHRDERQAVIFILYYSTLSGIFP